MAAENVVVKRRASDLVEGAVQLDLRVAGGSVRTLRWIAWRQGSRLQLEITGYLMPGDNWIWRKGHWWHKGLFDEAWLQKLPPETARFWSPLLEVVENALIGWSPELIRGGVEGLFRLGALRGLRGVPVAAAGDVLRDWPREWLGTGTDLYHGTCSRRNFRVPAGPAFFTTSLDTAGWYSRWKYEEKCLDTSSEGRPRILTFQLRRAANLLFLDDGDDLVRLMRALGDPGDYVDPRDIAGLLCARRIADGWTTSPYYPDGPETMLCRPRGLVEFRAKDLSGLGANPWDRHLPPPARPTPRSIVEATARVRDPRVRFEAMLRSALPGAPPRVRFEILERALRLRARGVPTPVRAALLQVVAEHATKAGAPEGHLLSSWGLDPHGFVAGRGV